MRTTLTLDPDVVRMIEEETHRRRVTTKQVVNDALRRGLQPEAGARKKYRPQRFHAELAPGIDPARFNQLADELETDAVMRTSRS